MQCVRFCIFLFFLGIWSRFAIGSVFESRVVRRSRKECKINWNVQYQIDRRLCFEFQILLQCCKNECRVLFDFAQQNVEGNNSLLCQGMVHRSRIK